MLGDHSTPICGERHESNMDGYEEQIQSKEITYFEYDCSDFFLKAEKKDNKIKIVASGGYSNHRDGNYFRINYETEDLFLLDNLQTIIEQYEVSKDNGHCLQVDGLPAGLGDKIDILYASGETIYKTSNQARTLSDETSKAIYEAFHEFVKKKGLDFNSEGSNAKLYDDADEEYLQGTWKGKHFGSEISVTFKENKVIISVDGKETDKEEYTIVEGTVISNRLKEGITEPKDKHDYEYFKGVSCFAKKNWFTITGYFLENSYSTCDLMNFDKEKTSDDS